MSTINAMNAQRIPANRLLSATVIAAVGASIANLIVFLVADALWDVAWEPLFNALYVVGGTFGAIVAASVVLALVARSAQDPARTYTLIAIVVLLLSFVPPVLSLLGVRSPFTNGAPDIQLDTVIVMILTHIIAFAISTPIFTRLAREV